MVVRFEDKLCKVIDKLKFSPSVFSFILSNCIYFKYLILQNNKKIDISEITNGYNYISSCINKYESLIVKYNIERKPTKLFHDELKKNIKLLTDYENRLLNVLEKELPSIKEIITIQNTHILINKKMLHNLDSPCIYNNDWNDSNPLYYINDVPLTEEDWKKHPLVRTFRINKIIKKINKRK